MKKTKNLQKLFALLLAFGMLLSLAVGVSAEEENKEWVLAADQSRITDGETHYMYYELPYGDWFRPHAIYEYLQTVAWDDYYQSASVAQPMIGDAVHPEMVYLFNYLTAYGLHGVYVTESGKRALDAYLDGEYAQYEFAESYYTSSVMTDTDAEALINSTPNCSVDVTTLKGAPRYEIIGYDSSLSFAHVIGAVFEKDGEYLYFHYATLPNYCFDSEGNLSFRSGTAPAYLLDAASAEMAEEYAESMSDFSTEISSEPMSPTDEAVYVVFFWFLLIPLFLLAIPFLALGVIFAILKKGAARWRWLGVIALSLIWIVLSFIISILCIVLAIL